MIGRDGDTGQYRVSYFDDRNVSRLYEMNFQNGAWDMWRDYAGFPQRFHAALSDDGNIISGYWARKQGDAWIRDFGVTFTRVDWID